MAKGFEVFRNLSPHGKYDIVAEKDHQFFGIEVRTGLSLKAGGYSYSLSKIRAEFLAVVINSTVYYEPKLPEAV